MPVQKRQICRFHDGAITVTVAHDDVTGDVSNIEVVAPPNYRVVVDMEDDGAKAEKVTLQGLTAKETVVPQTAEMRYGSWDDDPKDIKTNPEDPLDKKLPQPYLVGHFAVSVTEI